MHRTEDEENNDCLVENAVDPDEVCVIYCLPNPTMIFHKQSVFFKVYEKGWIAAVNQSARVRSLCLQEEGTRCTR